MKRVNFINFLRAIFWDENVPMPPFLILVTCTKSILSTLTTFHQLLYYFYQYLPLFTTFHCRLLPYINFYQHSCYFYQLFKTSHKFLLPFTNLYQLLTNFYQCFISLNQLYCNTTFIKAIQWNKKFDIHQT